jgi:hypothetical protein
MNFSKKAIATYIVVILVTSSIIALFFLAILGSLYSEEDPLCQELNFDIEETCVVRDGIRTKIVNLGDSPLELLINGGNKQTLTASEIKVFSFNTRDESIVEISPIISISGKIIGCSSKKETIDTKLISTPCK